ncbi:scarecrow-like protein 14 [Diospyros lotus]|uniref:scarecrow-like protein 14 n=1 Tax=Diospyros lotus TaxID=55363 RepID=UPI0022579712|nr:scarecrow-like protein 14 [Diospyros lotus]XP_052185512.1 scarecrow-like protein 14 [Diospyros lotus]
MLSNSFDSKGGDSTEENDLCCATLTLRYINQVLMKDDLDDEACMIQESTLHAAEKSLYEMLNKYPSSSNQHFPYKDTSSMSDDYISHSSSKSVESGIVPQSFQVQVASSDNTSLSNSGLLDPQEMLSFWPARSSGDTNIDGLEESLVNVPLDNQSRFPFNVGTEERKINLTTADCGILEEPKAEKDERGLPDSFLKGRKNLDWEVSDLGGGGTKKKSAVYADESIFHDLFNKALSLYDDGKNESSSKITNGSSPKYVSREPDRQNGRARKYCIRKGTNKREAVRIRSLLMQCMQFVAANDQKSACELLKQIRASSTPWGKGYQRLAHYFANSLEARLMGGGAVEYKTLAAWNMTDTEMLKAYKMCLAELPTMKVSFYFASEMIMQVIGKATRVHIIDFGTSMGLQWSILIQRLSTRTGGPPNLRITGIDLPQAGFRPDARARQTGLCLANYCERIGFPFQYKGIAQKWETLTVEDLGIEKDEVLVVNCLYFLAYLIDDTTMEHSPRDAVLNLIKRINPDIFVYGISNAAMNSPFFISRFREALFYYSTLFNMFESCLPCESQERMVFEREIWGMKILNTIACEGLERVERLETYRDWHFRTLRAGFKQLPLNQEMMKKVRAMVKSNYHKDFSMDEDKQWMLERWKGKVLSAYSCWKPA